MKKNAILLAGIIVLLAGLLVACGEAPDAATPADEAAIYAAAIRQLYTVDHTFGQPPNWPTVYVISTTDDNIGTLTGEGSDPRTLSSETQQAITEALSDLPTEIVWIGDRSEAPISDQNGTVDYGDAIIITLGNIHPQDDGSVQLPASLYCGMLCATGMTYVLEQTDGTWQVTGTTGPVWIS
jgi:hypothetical protein